MAGIPRLKSSDLVGLLPRGARRPDMDDLDSSSEGDGHYESSPLQTLILNNTNVDDKAWRYIASCENLRTLELAGTKLSCKYLLQLT